MPRRSPEPSKFDQNMQLLNTIIGLGQTGLGIYGGIQDRRMKQQDQEMQKALFGLQKQSQEASLAEQARGNRNITPYESASLLGIEGPMPVDIQFDEIPQWLQGQEAQRASAREGREATDWWQENQLVGSGTLRDLVPQEFHGLREEQLGPFLNEMIAERGDYRQDELQRGRMGLEDSLQRGRMDYGEQLQRQFLEDQSDVGPAWGYGNILDQLRRDEEMALRSMGRVDQMGNPVGLTGSDDPREIEPKLGVWNRAIQRLGQVQPPSDETEWTKIRQLYPPGFGESDLQYLFQQMQGTTEEKKKAQYLNQMSQILELERAMKTMDPGFSWGLPGPSEEGIGLVSPQDQLEMIIRTYQEQYNPRQEQRTWVGAPSQTPPPRPGEFRF